MQNQILALAKSIRKLGTDVRVLGPCDGPPPDTGITPLGNSLPTATNGSIAPLAPDAAAQLRVIRALRDEQFTFCMCHEPLAPGPTITSIVPAKAHDTRLITDLAIQSFMTILTVPHAG